MPTSSRTREGRGPRTGRRRAGRGPNGAPEPETGRSGTRGDAARPPCLFEAIPPAALPEFRLGSHLARWEFKARHDLTASDAQSLPARDLLALPRDGGRGADADGALGALLDLPLHDTEPSGAPDLREVVAATYARCGADDLLCFAGAEEGIFCFYHAVLEPGAHAVVITPNYQSAEAVPLSICAATGVALDEGEGWTLHIDQVAAAIRPETRSIYVDSSHNPTGETIERDRFDALVDLCRRHGLWPFFDEVYRLIEHDPASRLPQAADVYERGVSLNVMSKVYGLPGLRIGWIACRDRSLLGRMARPKDYLLITNSGPSERLALIALERSEAVLARTRGATRARRRSSPRSPTCSTATGPTAA